MDFLISDSGATSHSGATLSWDIIEVCNNLQNAVAITYIFALQQPAFWFCNFLHFYFTINKYAGDIKNYYDNYNGNVDDMISDFMHEDDIWQSPEEYFDSRESCEPFEEYYTTPGGEEIVAFGYAGWDA